MKYYIIAGERSGDLHAGNLAKSIRNHDPGADLKGLGGEFMQQAGVSVDLHYRDLAFMGLFEVFSNLRKIAKYTKLCKDEIVAFNPDVIILIDYGGFNLGIAKFAKKRGYKVFYYIPPKYWAWYQNRALWLKPNVDRLFVILPFEKEFFKKFDWHADYVGNPVLDAVKAHTADDQFMFKNQLPSKQPFIALLPGSRKQELKRIIPLMAAVARKLPSRTFGVAVVNNLDRSLYNDVSQLSNVKLIVEDTYNLLLHASAAVVTSGTATLETALFRVPQVVVYKASTLSYWIGKQLIKVPFISLVNLIAGKEVVKEMIQSQANPESVTKELTMILDDNIYRNNMLQGYNEVVRILDTGSASENAARLMVNHLTGTKVSVNVD